MMAQAKGLQAARRHKVGILWLKGFSLRDIQKMIQMDKEIPGANRVSLVTIWKDTNAVKGKLLEANLDKLEILRTRSVQHLRLIQSRAWTELAGATSGTRSSLLAVIAASEERIAKLEGTFAPVQLTGKGGEALIPKAPLILNLADGTTIRAETLGKDGNGSKDEAIPDR